MAAMLSGLPPPIHRALLRTAHRIRITLWGWLGTEVHGCNALAFDRHGRLLLVRHSYQNPQHWMLPGGGLGRREDPVAAAARELVEETGCRLNNAHWFATDVMAIRGGWRNRVELVAGVTDDEPRADRRELEEARFFALDALPPMAGQSVVQRISLWRDWRARMAASPDDSGMAATAPPSL